ncbi:unnamed protein product [Peniophora sp. CBMAI 1063]|nr:unnamed protein product [Peniophora sp. CBMAI 1063]
MNTVMADSPIPPFPTLNTPPNHDQQPAFAASGTQPSTPPDSAPIYAASGEHPAHLDTMEDAPLNSESFLLEFLIYPLPSSQIQPTIRVELPQPGNIVLGEEALGTARETSSRTWGVCVTSDGREVLHVPANPSEPGYSPQSIPIDLVQRELDIQPLHELYPDEPIPDYELPEPEPVKPQHIEPTYDRLHPPPVESKKRKLDDDSEVDSASPRKKKTQKGGDKENAVEDGTRGRKGKAVAPATTLAPAPLPAGPGESVERLIFENMAPKQRDELVNVSQIWKIIPCREDEASLEGVLHRVRAIRPTLGGNNGRILADKKAVESLFFAGCCGNTAAHQTTCRHAVTKQGHYARLRERALVLAKFAFYRCTTCENKGERKDIFKGRHASNCAHQNTDPEPFAHRLTDPNTSAVARERFTEMRDDCIASDKNTFLGNGPITDHVVAELMDRWDVVPDALCDELRPREYYCFSEAEIEARDVAAHSPTTA